MPNVSVSGIDQNGNTYANQSRQLDKLPVECPVCGVTIIPQFFSQGFVANNVLELFSRCANHKCSRSFISLYRLDPGRSQGQPAQQYFSFERSLPVEAKRKETPPEIATLSPSFAKIAAQAQTAEASGLDEVAGPGYRKALEFLIKDYAISAVAPIVWTVFSGFKWKDCSVVVVAVGM